MVFCLINSIKIFRRSVAQGRKYYTKFCKLNQTPVVMNDYEKINQYYNLLVENVC